MKLVSLSASRYRSLKDVSDLRVGPLSVLIGANASGKSNVVDALRLVRDGLREDDFAEPVNQWRGGFLHLAWKGEAAGEVRIDLTFDDDGSRYRWSVKFTRVQGSSGFSIVEEIVDPHLQRILEANGGEGWWRTQGHSDRVLLKLRSETACALAAAAADANFPARGLADFVREWSFFDPNPIALRRSMSEDRGVRLDASGRNLALRLHTLHEDQPQTFERIVAATRSVLGLPEGLEFRESDLDGRVVLLQKEPNLVYRVPQPGMSSGTLRILALMTALYGETQAGLVGIEEPENYVHPLAIEAFAEHLRAASERVQIIVTTHSPLLLDCLASPEFVCIVRRTAEGTKVERPTNPEAVRQALEESGFGLGQFYQTKGFGA